jgi:sulfite reductase (NADPH) flavoprotein alpha-component
MFDYFGYGSNLDPASLRAKGVVPVSWTRGVVAGWRLRFNVAHFFRHEGGVANIERTGHAADRVHGVVLRLEDGDLAALDEAEAYPDGYGRTTVAVDTGDGTIEAVTYVGTPAFIDNTCLPSKRYLNIVVRGAELAELDPSYVEQLRRQPVLEPRVDPPFEHPAGDHPTFTAVTLAGYSAYTALDGAVFDMTNARSKHQLLRGVYGGRDMTAHHLRRLDTSDGTEEGVAVGGRTQPQQAYLNTLLHAYAEEYTYVGRLVAAP